MLSSSHSDRKDVDHLTREFIAESQEILDRMERYLTDLEARPLDLEQIVGELFRAVHTLKGTTGFMGFSRMEKLAHAGEYLLGSLRDGTVAVSEDVVEGLLRLLDGLRGILTLIEATRGEGERAADEDSALILQLARLDGRDSSPQAEGVGLKARIGEEISEDRRGSAGTSLGTGLSTSEKTLRIDVEVLDRMMNLVGELVLTRNEVLQSGPEAMNLPELARRLESITTEMRETVMEARMQPVGNLFGKFPRMVRELERVCGRHIRLEFSGRETTLDKSLLEAIKDPLTHAVRNAIDHGVEPPEARVRAGKSVTGTVHLKAFHQGGSVVIEVSDDGAGISIERVLARAIERGLVTAEQAAEMSEREALQLIFLPGFSTAATVTTVSGRGVGMDVIRANVEQVGGRVELDSKVGVGTTLRLRVPLTMAIVPALIIRSGDQSFALPQSALAELIYIPANEAGQQIERIGESEVYRLRDHLLPMVRLNHLLGLKSFAEPHGVYVAVLETECCRYGLIVDDLVAPGEIVMKPLSAVLREIGVFSGATMLGNGTLALILDVVAVAERAGIRLERIDPDEQAETTRPVEDARQETDVFVVFEDRVRERMALPLEFVERIEDIPLAQIEYADGRPLLEYRGELLRLHDEGRLLDEIGGETRPNAEAAATVLICGRSHESGKRMGIVVRRVLDISDGRLIEGETPEGGAGFVRVREKLTTVWREEKNWQAEKSWREVA
jgi:two-component system chemotaxis sensor kinase CheA